MTNTGVLTAPDGSIIIIDPGVFPDELAALARRAGEGRLLATLSTHEDWDHVLWSPDFPDDVPRLAHAATVRILESEREELIASLSAAENDFGVRWVHDLVGRLQPVSGERVALGAGITIAIIPTPGHTGAHTSFWLEEEGVLFAGDMLSDIDIPMLMPQPDAAARYLASLDTLDTIITSATTVIPGHGTPCDPGEARRRLDLDRAYLHTLLDIHDRTGPLERFLPDDHRSRRATNTDAHRQNVHTLWM